MLMKVVRESPLCAELEISELTQPITPNDLFYHRNNFPYPESWPGVTVEGEFERPLALDTAALEQRPQRSLTVTLECAGNGRRFLDPPVAGEPWGIGAVGTATWQGPALGPLLEEAGPRAGVVEILFEAADGFARSLPLERALHPDTLLVTRMNGEPLPREHGGPLRLLVPGWYGMAAVKWLVRIAALKEPFRGHFQVERYVVGERPVREMRVRALITSPAEGAQIKAGEALQLQGLAWSGAGEVTRVEVSADGGGSWREAELGESAGEYAWRTWSALVEPPDPGTVILLARAEDGAGRRQPLEQNWNQLGYENNAALPVRVRAL